MALRADISRSDDWFVGEAKILQFVIWQDKTKDALEDITGWTLSYDFYRRKVLAFSLDMDDIQITDGPGGKGQVAVAGARTAALTDLSELHHVLRRVDAGQEAILLLGDVILNDPTEG